MARRVFFSFHYERDIWRANVVRKSWVTQEREEAGFWDASLWEEAKRRGNDAIKRMIDAGMQGSSVTVVLIGTETWERPWVKYEIQKSHAEGKGLLGVYIHYIQDNDRRTDTPGPNPFASLVADGIRLSLLYPTYDYVANNGYSNMGLWIEEAARKTGR